MMKNTLVFAFFLISGMGMAQDSLYYQNSFGLDVTSTLKNVLTFETDEIEPYSLVLKFPLSKKTGLRIGASFGYFKDEDIGDQFFSIRTTTTQHTSLRIGFENYYPLKKNFFFFWGADFLGAYQKERSEVNSFSQDYNLADEVDWSLGFGPVLGIEYLINRYMKIGTESTLYALYTNSKTTTSGSNVPTFSFTADEFSIQHILPQSLYFYILF